MNIKEYKGLGNISLDFAEYLFQNFHASTVLGEYYLRTDNSVSRSLKDIFLQFETEYNKVSHTLTLEMSFTRKVESYEFADLKKHIEDSLEYSTFSDSDGDCTNTIQKINILKID